MAFSCNKCNAPIGNGESFCSECGTKANLPIPVRPLSLSQSTITDRPCPRCGELNAISEAFCSRCGAPVTLKQETIPTRQAETPPQPKRFPLGWVIGAVCIVCFTLFVFVQVNQKHQEEEQLEASLRLQQFAAPSEAPVVSPPMPTQAVPAMAPRERNYQHLMTCPSCGGTGKCSACAIGFAIALSGGPGKCAHCHGTGRSDRKNALGYYEDCVSCRGTGRCSICGGSGQCPICGGRGSVTREVADSVRASNQALERAINAPPLTGASSPGSGTNFQQEDMPKLMDH